VRATRKKNKYFVKVDTSSRKFVSAVATEYVSMNDEM
jgi:hypothetical protein